MLGAVKRTARSGLMRVFSHALAMIAGLTAMLLYTTTFNNIETYAAKHSAPVSCHTQGATITKDYFLYTDWCGDDDVTTIFRCDRDETNISNCRKMVEGKFRHANVLYHVWDNDYFWVFDSGSPRKSGKAWCYSLDGRKINNSECGTLPYNYGPQIDASQYKYLQGFTKYGNYHLKGVSGPNQIAVLHDKKLEKVLTVGYNGEELEDVSVDGDTGEIYFTTHSNKSVKLYKYSGYKLPVSTTVPSIDQSAMERLPNDNTDQRQDGNQQQNNNQQPTQHAESTTIQKDSSVKTGFFGEIEDDGNGCGIYKILYLVIDILSIGVGIVAVVGITLSGITYMTAGGNPQKTTVAKRRIAEIVIGIVLYALLYTIVNFLLPGGKLNPSDVCLAIR